MTIASKQVRFPKNAINLSRYIVKFEDDQEWSLFYCPIEGFEYEEGHEYVINVKVINVSDPLMDASSKEYKLNYIISCEEKESASIPDSWFEYSVSAIKISKTYFVLLST
ncbi:MAG: DUF4377 domain-containing protein [Tannerella sp.]|nr:DUF4377 domain-containing protein [Tannerella sp.]